jgi:tetratricopeptide (TPR) repeat protein
MVTISQSLTRAFQAFRAGKMVEAEWICDQILQQQPDHVTTLNLLGAIAYRTSRLETAIAYYRRVIELQPNQADAHSNLAVVLQERGDLDAAAEQFQQSLAFNPNHAQTHFNLGNLLLKQKDLEKAIVHYRQAIALKPDYASAHNNLGHALRSQGNWAAAMQHYQQAIALSPNDAQFYANLGNILQEQGRFQAAFAQYDRALTLQPNNAEVYFNLGNGLREFYLLHTETETEALALAIDTYQQAIALAPDRAAFHNNLALALQEQNQFQEAIAHLQQAIALEPDNPESHNNLGMMFYEQQDLVAAMQHCQRAIDLNPEFAEAHLNLGIALLAAGDWQRGFAEYEWRWQCQELLPEPLPENGWDGSDLQGRTLLLHAEQGFGDTIQFIRYVPRLAERGGQVIVECPPELARLLATIPGISQLLSTGEPRPPFDVHLPLMSLPRVLGETPETLPNQIPYLQPPPDCNISLENSPFSPPSPPPHPHPLRIGIAWASGKPRYHRRLRWYRTRTVPLAVLMQLATVPEVSLYSLQVGSHAADIAQEGFGEQLCDLSQQIQDFADTASAIAQLDLVICVDTAVAHLAGAMGKTVWLLLPFAPDWRWMLHRNDSPWYPTMRLFRQKSPGDWDGVMTEVIGAIAELISGVNPGA